MSLETFLKIELQPAEVFFRCDSAAKSDSVSQSSVRLNAQHIWRGPSYKYQSDPAYTNQLAYSS